MEGGFFLFENSGKTEVEFKSILLQGHPENATYNIFL